ncbi:hypothetical protein I4U23_008567 [Adineta vaga]|nr:hypothetical protein I4U23_008567 [Adineta vaga]
MGKRGRKPIKSDSNTRLEKSRESARQCRHRKKLRYEYLEELVTDREKAIIQLQQELERLRTICQYLDQNGVNNEIRQELSQWKDDPDIRKFKLLFTFIIMVRKLRFHERKLLKKVDFINWEVDKNLHEVTVMRKFHIQKREDYTKYNDLSRRIRDLARKIKELDANDPFRIEATRTLLEKLHAIGLVPTRENLELVDKITASRFCRRRLPVIMTRNHMAQHLPGAVKFIEQGHVRIGPDIVSDPAFLVTRNTEDFISWTDNSAIRKQLLEYQDMETEIV